MGGSVSVSVTSPPPPLFFPCGVVARSHTCIIVFFTHWLCGLNFACVHTDTEPTFTAKKGIFSRLRCKLKKLQADTCLIEQEQSRSALRNESFDRKLAGNAARQKVVCEQLRKIVDECKFFNHKKQQEAAQIKRQFDHCDKLVSCISVQLEELKCAIAQAKVKCSVGCRTDL